MLLTTACSEFVGSATDGMASESGTPGATSDASTGEGPVASVTTEVASTTTVGGTTDSTTASTSTTSTGGSTGDGSQSTQSSGTTRGSDPTTSESTAAVEDCDNNNQDGEETDVDCGGPSCSVCEFGEGCEVGTDCVTGFCSPSMLCGLQSPVVWLDALDADTLYNEDSCTDSPPTAGQEVHCWGNKGSHGGVFVVGGSRPGYPEPLDGVEFDNDTMLSTDAVFGGPLGDVSVFLVQTELASRNSFDFNLDHPNENGDRYSAHIPFGNSNRRVIFDIGGSGGGARISTAPGVIDVGETHLFTFVNSAQDDERLIHIDGTQAASGAGALSADAGIVSIGNGSRATVHEFRVYTPSPSAVQRQVIEGQLACRWQLRDELPAAHPFYNADGASQDGCPAQL